MNNTCRAADQWRLYLTVFVTELNKTQCFNNIFYFITYLIPPPVKKIYVFLKSNEDFGTHCVYTFILCSAILKSFGFYFSTFPHEIDSFFFYDDTNRRYVCTLFSHVLRLPRAFCRTHIYVCTLCAFIVQQTTN